MTISFTRTRHKTSSYRTRLLSVSALCIFLILVINYGLPLLPINYYKLSGPGRIYQFLQYRMKKSFNNMGAEEFVLLENPIYSPTPNHSTSEDWQIIYGKGDTDFFVYSAYLDKDRNKRPIIRIVAVTISYTSQPFYCYLQNEEFKIYAIVSGHAETTKTYIDSRYSSAFIICPLDFITTHVTPSRPIYVSVSSSYNPIALQEYGTLQLHIKNAISDEHKYPHQFGVCVQPIFNYDKVSEFIQWIEYNIMMGVTYFVFYNISLGPNVSCVMRACQEDEDITIEILPWSIPIKDDDRLHNNGQYAQANECAFRARGLSEFVLMIDLDEYIIPKTEIAENYAQLMAKVREQGKAVLKSGAIPAQYGFANVIFDTECRNGEKVDSAERSENKGSEMLGEKDLIIYRHVERRNYLEYGTKKFITTPDLVIEPGIHNLADSVDGRTFTELKVDPNLAFMHHYKNFSNDGNPCSKSVTIDETGRLYSENLAELVKKRIEKVSKSCLVDIQYQ